MRLVQLQALSIHSLNVPAKEPVVVLANLLSSPPPVIQRNTETVRHKYSSMFQTQHKHFIKLVFTVSCKILYYGYNICTKDSRASSFKTFPCWEGRCHDSLVYVYNDICPQKSTQKDASRSIHCRSLDDLHLSLQLQQ